MGNNLEKFTNGLGDARNLENLLKRQKGGVGFYRLTGLPQPGQPHIPRLRDRGFNPVPASDFFRLNA
jgi:hypothetical protein